MWSLVPLRIQGDSVHTNQRRGLELWEMKTIVGTSEEIRFNLPDEISLIVQK